MEKAPGRGPSHTLKSFEIYLVQSWHRQYTCLYSYPDGTGIVTGMTPDDFPSQPPAQPGKVNFPIKGSRLGQKGLSIGSGKKSVEPQTIKNVEVNGPDKAPGTFSKHVCFDHIMLKGGHGKSHVKIVGGSSIEVNGLHQIVQDDNGVHVNAVLLHRIRAGGRSLSLVPNESVRGFRY